VRQGNLARTQKATVDPWTKPPTPQEVGQAHAAYNQQVSRLQAAYDRTLSRVQASGDATTPENVRAIEDARAARDTGIADAKTQRDTALQRGPATRGAAGEPAMSSLVLPPGQGAAPPQAPHSPVPYSGAQPFFGGGGRPTIPAGGGTVTDQGSGKSFQFTPEQLAQVEAILRRGGR
jgi:hypothetical protein